MAGAGVAVVLFYAAGTAVLLWYILSGRNLARFRLTRLRWPLFRDILAVGAVAADHLTANQLDDRARHSVSRQRLRN